MFIGDELTKILFKPRGLNVLHVDNESSDQTFQSHRLVHAV